MVIKIQTADSSHGHNAINYAMNKKADDGRKPEFISSGKMPWDNIFGDSIEPRAVWDYMKMRQKNCGRKIEDPFFHIELCPSKEESAGFTKSDWIKLIDDSIRNLSTPFVSKRRGKIKGWNIKNSQWVACLHTDTDKPHIHLILNRITEDNKVLDDTQYKDRAKQAANRLAVERGWTKAESVGERDGAERKNRIHKDAIDVLACMNKFNLERYFEGMRSRGWIIDAKYDSKGICRGYSVGERLFKVDGSLSSTILVQSSKLGFGRDLMVSKLQGTWNRLHRPQIQRGDNVSSAGRGSSMPTYNNVENNPAKREELPKMPQWKCSSYDAMQNWNDEEIMNARIPDAAFDIIDKLVEPVDKFDYCNPNSEIPERMQMLAVAVFEFCTAADVPVMSGGGGGGSSDNDLRWDGKTAEDFENMARNAVGKAKKRCLSHLSKRSTSRGWGR